MTGELIYDAYIVGLNRSRQNLYDRINQRVDIMMDCGFVDEVQSLLQNGAKIDWQSMKGIGYREIASYLNGDIDLDTAVYEMKKLLVILLNDNLRGIRKCHIFLGMM